MELDLTSSRHPYTYACDFIRALAGHNESGTKLSRSDASLIRMGIAEVIGMSDEELAGKLSIAQQSKTEKELDDEANLAFLSLFPHLAKELKNG